MYRMSRGREYWMSVYLDVEMQGVNESIEVVVIIIVVATRILIGDFIRGPRHANNQGL